MTFSSSLFCLVLTSLCSVNLPRFVDSCLCLSSSGFVRVALIFCVPSSYFCAQYSDQLYILYFFLLLFSLFISAFTFFFFFTLESPHHSLQHSYIGSVITSHSLFLQGFLKKTLLNRSLTFFFLIYFTFFNLA